MRGTSAPVSAREERRRWEIEQALQTLSRAEQIKRDPKLMADVRVLAADVKRAAGREPPKGRK